MSSMDANSAHRTILSTQDKQKSISMHPSTTPPHHHSNTATLYCFYRNSNFSSRLANQGQLAQGERLGEVELEVDLMVASVALEVDLCVRVGVRVGVGVHAHVDVDVDVNVRVRVSLDWVLHERQPQNQLGVAFGGVVGSIRVAVDVAAAVAAVAVERERDGDGVVAVGGSGIGSDTGKAELRKVLALVPRY